MIYGITFSHRKAQSLGIDPVDAFRQILQLKFDVIRLGCYWDEIEKREGEYDFSVIRSYLEACEQYKQNVILTVGMKAPNWPEFYIPRWLQTASMEELAPRVYALTEKTVSVLKSFSSIKYWQVENEPLDPSGPKQLRIPAEQLVKQVALVKSLDPERKVIVNLWGNDVLQRNFAPHIAEAADIIGVDIYYKQFLIKKFSFSVYSGPRHTVSAFCRQAKQWKKPVWITELQAEPWEASTIDYKSVNPKSMNPALLLKNVARAKLLQPQAILLWGSEYWLWKKSQGDSGMWETVKKIILNAEV